MHPEESERAAAAEARRKAAADAVANSRRGKTLSREEILQEQAAQELTKLGATNFNEDGPCTVEEVYFEQMDFEALPPQVLKRITLSLALTLTLTTPDRHLNNLNPQPNLNPTLWA